ncbi:MAG: Electron transport complex protein rnfE [Candidatus Magnetoglobus multicellularis str. Araruama]|uniref:Electron transport complex protein rnfE n=1 Tax=Candidatus Magnetoglobus multicellularis str. Araruama TaxID=890399 RepID=A0A1V1PEG0_9BACT|nr:MAG: Electron transport complex protein rnfE [Candidatus Magnetoglobus multicellularis str. Araruama]
MIENNKSYGNIFLNGILNDNPIFRLALSMCPAVGISTNMMNGLLMGIAVLFVQFCSSLTISLVKNIIHPRIRIPTYTLTIATWVTVTDLVLAAFFPVAYKSLGIFVRLIVVFCFITMRLDVFARKNPVFPSLVDAVGMGFGFLLGMMAIGGVREIMGMGTLLGYDILGFRPLLFFVLPCSGFFVVGFMMAIFNYTEIVYNRRKRARSLA